jgi:hypothetical protein
MRTVLYTTDFEPITVLDLPVWLLERMEQEGGARVAVMPRLTPEVLREDEPAAEPKLETVDILCEKLRWRDGTLKTILVTPSEELALSLRPEWLPGQQQAINFYKRTIVGLVEQLQKQFRKP